MKKDLVFYGDIHGDIDAILIFPSIINSLLVCKGGTKYSLYDVTEDGELYIDGKWKPFFSKECDTLFLRHIYTLIDIIELNERTFPKGEKSSA